tara:strand:+ start:410 stop:679 length:270 start_codon:yes stop_codon:yes gene_type:complete
MSKPWYMTAQRRKQMDKQFQTMLRQNHDRLLHWANDRDPETVEGVLAKCPELSREQAEKIAKLNVRTNALNRDIEDLIMRIDPRWQDED